MNLKKEGLKTVQFFCRKQLFVQLPNNRIWNDGRLMHVELLSGVMRLGGGAMSAGGTGPRLLRTSPQMTLTFIMVKRR